MRRCSSLSQNLGLSLSLRLCLRLSLSLRLRLRLSLSLRDHLHLRLVHWLLLKGVSHGVGCEISVNAGQSAAVVVVPGSARAVVIVALVGLRCSHVLGLRLQ